MGITYKGPAAGLIAIIAGAVADFGGGETGWKFTLGAIVVAGFIQILFGVFKLGKLADFFPLSAIHGMLAAIGIIIIAKQVTVLLDVDPAMAKGKGPLQLIANIPDFIAHLDPKATAIGVISLAIMMGWAYIKNDFIRKIPAPLIVLLIAIPAGLMMNFQTTEPKYALNLNHFKHDYELEGGILEICGLDNHKALSDHNLATRKNLAYLTRRV